MQTYLNKNNLVDLISDKHAKLRKKVIEAWVQNGEEKIIRAYCTFPAQVLYSVHQLMERSDFPVNSWLVQPEIPF